MTDKQNPGAAGKGAAATGEEYRDISYFAWKRGFAAPRADAPSPANSAPANGSRLT